MTDRREQGRERAALLEAAEERLMDAGLDELVGAADDAAARPAPAAIRRRGGAGLALRAAALLLGCGVVAAVFALSRATDSGREDDVGAQDPVLPPPVVVDDPAKLGEVDPATVNLVVHVGAPADLAPLERLRELRSLRIEAVAADFMMDGAHERAWHEAGDGALDVLRRCPELRVLSLGYLPGFAPGAGRVLADLRHLEELRLAGVRHIVDEELAELLGKLPVRRLHLAGVRVTPEGLAGICELPVLRELTLRMCLHLGACDLSRLGRLGELRRLVLQGVGGELANVLERTHPLEEPKKKIDFGPMIGRAGVPHRGEPRQVLAADTMRAIAALPRLRSLCLRGSVVDDEVMGALPRDLRALEVDGVVGLTSAGVDAVARLEGLERLSFSTRASGVGDVREDINLDRLGRRVWLHVPSSTGAPSTDVEAAWGDALPGWRLRSLAVHGGVSPRLAAAIGGCASLESVDVVASVQSEVDVAFAAALPDLRVLELRNTQRLDVAPLAGARALERVALHGASDEVVAAVRGALEGRDVTLSVE